MRLLQESGYTPSTSGIAYILAQELRIRLATSGIPLPPTPPSGGPPPPGAMGAVRRQGNNVDPYMHFNDRAPLFADPIKKYGFEWWANYFYQEANGPDKKAFYMQMYNADRTLKDPYNSKSLAKDEDAWKQILLQMLAKGFTAYPDAYKKVDDVLFPPLQGNQLLRLGFRGELRQPMQVKQHNGCMPKAQIESVRKDMGMSHGWHPFSDGAIRSKVYYRKGNGDNCLYSAVSVTHDFATATKFPMIDDLYKDAPDAIGTATVKAFGLASKVDQLRQKFGAVAASQPKPKANEAQVRLLKCVRMNVYLFRVRGNTYDTKAYQAKNYNSEFEERAMEKTPWGDFLARVMIDRIHFGEEANDGHVNVVHGYELLHTNEDLLKLFGGGAAAADALAKLKAYLTDLVDQGAWRPGGAPTMILKTETSNPAARVEEILKMEPRGDWGLNPSVTYQYKPRRTVCF